MFPKLKIETKYYKAEINSKIGFERAKEELYECGIHISTLMLKYNNENTFVEFSEDAFNINILDWLEDNGQPNFKEYVRKKPKLTSINTDIIEAIVSQEEMRFAAIHESYNTEDFVLISIQDPDDKKDLSVYHKQFKKALSIRFFDVEEDLGVKSGGFDVVPINNEQASEIADFIAENKEEKFFIHCAAGISRSAGVGLAVECMVKFNGNKYEMAITPSDIKAHFRYAPNLVVYDKIIENIDFILLDIHYNYECSKCKSKFDKHIRGKKEDKFTKLCPFCLEILEEYKPL